MPPPCGSCCAGPRTGGSLPTATDARLDHLAADWARRPPGPAPPRPGQSLTRVVLGPGNLVPLLLVFPNDRTEAAGAVRRGEQRSLERFVTERGDGLLRTAALLAGSRADGEDLLQSALERLLRNWRRIDGDPENYVRRTLYNLATDGWRRQRVWRRKAMLLEPAPPIDPATAVDLRDADGPGAGPASATPAGGPGVALLRAAERGGNGGGSGLLGWHSQVGGLPRAGPAT